MKLIVTQNADGKWTANLEATDTLPGRGESSREAIGDFFIHNADQLFGVDVDITEYRNPDQILLPTDCG